MISIAYLLQRAPSGRDPRLCGKVIQSTTLNIIKFVYETNNTFVTYKFEKHLWALKQRQNKNINERNVYMYNLYNYLSYILFSVFPRKTMKKFLSLPLKSPMCENVVKNV